MQGGAVKAAWAREAEQLKVENCQLKEQVLAIDNRPMWTCSFIREFGENRPYFARTFVILPVFL